MSIWHGIIDICNGIGDIFGYRQRDSKYLKQIKKDMKKPVRWDNIKGWNNMEKWNDINKRIDPK